MKKFSYRESSRKCDKKVDCPQLNRKDRPRRKRWFLIRWLARLIDWLGEPLMYGLWVRIGIVEVFVYCDPDTPAIELQERAKYILTNWIAKGCPDNTIEIRIDRPGGGKR